MTTLEHGKQLCQDVWGYYDNSLTKLQSQSRGDCERVQLAALQYRFGEFRDTIPMLKKLADRLKIDQINDLNDVVRLLFDHAMYKSYPPSLLHNNRFGELTRWLDKLTTCDLSSFDASDCHSVDDWLTALYERTPLNVAHTSGTSGVFSFLPKTKSGYEKFMKQYLISVLQVFGKETEPQKFPLNLHGIYPYYRSGGGHLRLNDLYVKYICGSEDRFHAAYPGRLSADMLLLSARIRAATAVGQLDQLEISPRLLARRDEFIREEEQKADHVARFFDEISQTLRGKRIFMQAVPGMLYQMAKAGLDRGQRGLFAADSIVVAGGGPKGTAMPADWDQYVKAYLGVDRVTQLYGMSESLTFMPMCEHGHHHMMPGLIPFILDPDTSEPLPRHGQVTGRWAHFDLVADAWWGGFITGDEVTMHWDGNCPCGRATAYIEKKIERYKDKKGDDKITCAATEESFQEAMDFLVGQEAN